EAERVFLSFVFKRGLHKLTFPITQIRDRINRISRIVPDNTGTLDKYQFAIEEIYPIEAELVFSQLSFLPWVIEKRIRNSVRLIESGILQDLGFRVPNPNDCIFTKFLVSHSDFRFSKFVRTHLECNGIETEQSYTPLSMREFNKVSRLVSTPNTDTFWKGAFCIPVNPLLSTEDIDRIVAILKSVKSQKFSK
ncbi:MAG: hypothetical protein GX577_07170, partial [Leptolinea sp.]|nr:hypothetical protein [Leptolinea sp.]